MELIEYSKFFFYSNEGLYKLLAKSIMDKDDTLSRQIIDELKKRSKNSEYTMTKDMQIEIIVGGMDYNRIRSVMESIKWYWYKGLTISGVPTIEEIKKHIYKGLSDVWELTEGRPHGIVSSGGFKYECTIIDGNKYLTASFVLSDYDVDHDTLTCEDYYGEFW